MHWIGVSLLIFFLPLTLSLDISSQGTSFNISITDEKINQLKEKVASTIFPDELEGAGWDYGSPFADISRLVTRWRNGYDWRANEAKLNSELPQFTRDIEVEDHGVLNVHYIHKKSEVKGAIPLLFVHGWPGSFIEVRKILPLLTNGSSDHPAFNVVALGLPGYGFSEAPKTRGFGIAQCAELGHKLMLALGYDEYVTQAGDWGYVITSKMAELYGNSHLKAWHTNTAQALPPKKPEAGPPYSERDKHALRNRQLYYEKSFGYYEEQSTQPQTLGYSLADSPVGLLGWIYEKLVTWTDAYPWEDDEVLTWISIYWFSRAGPAASVRLYYETNAAGLAFSTTQVPDNVPVGISYFPGDVNFPRRWLPKGLDLVFEHEQEKGGHFAAHEEPQALVDDVRQMFGKQGGAYGVVSGKNGF